jgi:hypothetical protein
MGWYANQLRNGCQGIAYVSLTVIVAISDQLGSIKCPLK